MRFAPSVRNAVFLACAFSAVFAAPAMAKSKESLLLDQCRLVSELKSLSLIPDEFVWPIFSAKGHSEFGKREAEKAFGKGKTVRTGCRTVYLRKEECIKDVTSNFDFSAQLLQPGSLKGKRFMSVGEGRSGLVQNLVDAGIDAYAVDIDESYKLKKDSQFAKSPKHYEWGDATQLTSTALVKKELFDLIISHRLLCELDSNLGYKSLVEAVQSLKEGGEVRAFFEDHKKHYFDGKYENMLKDVRSALRKSGIEIEMFSATLVEGLRLGNIERAIPTRGYPIRFLILKRLTKGTTPKNVQKACN